MIRLIRVALLFCAAGMFVFSAPAAGVALAAVGDLTQPAGSLGCIENNPSNAGDPCEAATYGLGLDGAEYVQTYGTNVYVMSGAAIEVLKRDASDPGLQDLQCLDGDGSDYGSNPACASEQMMAGSAFNAGSLRISTDGKWVFVDDSTRGDGGNELIVFSRNSSTGELSQASCYSANGENGEAEPLCTDLETANANYDAGDHLAVSPNGKWLYADDGQAITVFQVNDSTGALTASSCASEPDVSGCPDTFAAGTNNQAAEMVVSPDNKFLYFASPNGPEVQWLSIKPSTGELTNTGSAGAEDCIQDVSGYNSDGCVASMRGMVSMVGSLAISPDSGGKYIYALSGSEYAVGGVAVLGRDPTTGALSQVSGPAGCATSDGTDDERPAAEAGAPLPCEQDTGLEEAESLVTSPDGQNVYVMTGYEGNESMIELYVDQSTGALTEDSDVFGDCYTSNIREDAEPFCTGYNAMDGIEEGLNGEPTVGVSSDGGAVYVTSEGDSGLAIFQRQTPPNYTVAGVASTAAGGSVTGQSDSLGADCTEGSCSLWAGGAVSLQATANAGYRFSGWSGGSCAGLTDPCTVSNVQASETDDANFVQRFTVSGSVSGGTGGSVTVSSSAPNANCTTASCAVDAGSAVKLAANPAVGYKFSGWSGGTCVGTANPCTLNDVEASESDLATFVVIPRYTVRGTGSGSNTVTVSSSAPDASCSPGSCTVDAGDSVQLTANPAVGFLFTGWSGGICSGTTNPCTIANVEVSETDTAKFKPGYTVKATVSDSDAHAGNKVSASDSAAGASCSGSTCAVNPGDTVTLTATAHDGYTFSKWTGGSCGTTNPCSIKNVRANETDNADFTPLGAVISGVVNEWGGYGPGERPPLLSSYSDISVEVVNLRTAAVISGPVTPGRDGSYSVVVTDSDCSGGSLHTCLVIAEKSGAHSVGDERKFTLSSTQTTGTINLAFGDLGQFGVSGDVFAAPDGATVQTQLSLLTAVFHGTDMSEETIYQSSSDLCKGTDGKCGIGSYQLVPANLSRTQLAELTHDGTVELSEWKGNKWIPVDSTPIGVVAPSSADEPDVKNVVSLQAIDPVSATDEHHVLLGRVALLDPYAPTLKEPTPTLLTGYAGVSIKATPVNLAAGNPSPTATPDVDGNYKINNVQAKGVTADVPFNVQVSASKSGQQYLSFAQRVLIPRDDDPSATLLDLWFSQDGDVPLAGNIIPVSGHTVKTELVVTSGGQTVYDSLTSGLCAGDGGACSAGDYLIGVPAQPKLTEDVFQVQLNEENASDKWVKISSVTVPDGAPPIFGREGKNVPVLHAMYPVPSH